MAVFSITPLISAETGEGAAGCASGSQTCSGSRPGLRAEARRARGRTRCSARRRAAPSSACRRTCSRRCRPAARRSRAGSRSRRRARSAGTGSRRGGSRECRCSVVTRKNDASAIDSHATMNRYASSAISTSAIAARNTWYWKQMRPGRRALARAEVARGEQRDRRGRGAEEHQKERRQRVEPQVERQIRQAERQHRRLRQRTDRQQRVAAKPRPIAAPAGKSVRPTRIRLRGRTRPRTPIASHVPAAARTRSRGDALIGELSRRSSSPPRLPTEGGAAGTQCRWSERRWIPAFAGMTAQVI